MTFEEPVAWPYEITRGHIECLIDDHQRDGKKQLAKGLDSSGSYLIRVAESLRWCLAQIDAAGRIGTEPIESAVPARDSVAAPAQLQPQPQPQPVNRADDKSEVERYGQWLRELPIHEKAYLISSDKVSRMQTAWLARAALAVPVNRADSDAVSVATVSVNLTHLGGVSEVSEPVFEMAPAFERLIDANPGKSFSLFAAPPTSTSVDDCDLASEEHADAITSTTRTDAQAPAARDSFFDVPAAKYLPDGTVSIHCRKPGEPVDHDLLGNPIYDPTEKMLGKLPVPIPGVNDARPIACALPVRDKEPK
jgi:hypothetical protein